MSIERISLSSVAWVPFSIPRVSPVLSKIFLSLIAFWRASYSNRFFSSALNLSNSLYASCMFEFFSAIRFRSFLFFPLRKRIHCIKSVSLLFFSYQKIQNYCRNFRVQFDKILQTIFNFLCVIGLSARLSELVRFVADMLIDSFAAFRMITAWRKDNIKLLGVQ